MQRIELFLAIRVERKLIVSCLFAKRAYGAPQLQIRLTLGIGDRLRIHHVGNQVVDDRNEWRQGARAGELCLQPP